MKSRSKIMLGTLMATTLMSAPVFAGENAKMATPPAAHATSKHATNAMPASATPQYQQMLSQASKLMGHIGIANIAMFHDMIPEATANTKAALEIARTLESETAQFNADMMKSGKLRFKNESGPRDFWLPVVNDAFAVRSIDSEYMKSKKPTIEIADAKLVHTKVALDTKSIRNYLEKANAALEVKNYGEVQGALSAAAESTFTERDVQEMPLETVRDNLVLAHALMKDKNYGSANFALGHAEDTLKEYKAAAPQDHSAQVEQLQKEIGETRAEISKGKPDMLKKVEGKFSKWLGELENLGSKKN